MDKSREAFEEWKKREPQATNGYNAAMAWQEQQKRIDELQARLDAVEQVISKVRNGNYSSDQGECVAKFIACMLEQAIKGGEA